MNTVYVVCSDNNDRMSIFATQELAEEFIEKLGVEDLFVLPWHVRTETGICEGETLDWAKVDNKQESAIL